MVLVYSDPYAHRYKGNGDCYGEEDPNVGNILPPSRLDSIALLETEEGHAEKSL
jgi:hypothetical protein